MARLHRTVHSQPITSAAFFAQSGRVRISPAPSDRPMLDETARGVYAIAPTPFHDDGRIDTSSIDRMSNFYRQAGCDGITVLGIMGEVPKLDQDEAAAVASDAEARRLAGPRKNLAAARLRA